MTHPLDNVVWNSLIGSHAFAAIGSGGARRYAPEFSPITGFENTKCPDFASIEPYCEPGDRLHCEGWAGAAPSDWKIEFEATMLKMVWHGELPLENSAPDEVQLGNEHIQAALELTSLAGPGPFGPRTLELGDYFGVFDGVRLVAMAGERFHSGQFREISAVCTHPDYRGRGLARSLMLKLVWRQLTRGETPFLHVVSSNKIAHGLYERMGFSNYHETTLRVVRYR